MFKRACHLLSVTCLLCMLAMPAAARVILSSEHDSSSVRHFTQTLAQALPELEIDYVPQAQLVKQTQFNDDTQLILLGPALLDWRLQLTDAAPATLILQVSRVQAYQRIANQQPEQLTFLWSDPPLGRQIALLKIIQPDLQNIGVLYGNHSSFLLPEIKQALQTEGLTLQQYYWPDNYDARSLGRLLEQTDALLGIDDTHIFNSSSIKSILLSSYARKQTLIGPTAAFIKAGSLASSYSDQDDWIATLTQLLQMPTDQWPSSQYPNAFKVLINQQVARSLGIQKNSVSLVSQQLQQHEQTP